MPKTRNQYSADQKVAILQRHLIDRTFIADLCDEYKIHPTMFYHWQAQFIENGSAAATQVILNNPLQFLDCGDATIMWLEIQLGHIVCQTSFKKSLKWDLNAFSVFPSTRITIFMDDL